MQLALPMTPTSISAAWTAICALLLPEWILQTSRRERAIHFRFGARIVRNFFIQ
jgi:hypothetical protein